MRVLAFYKRLLKRRTERRRGDFKGRFQQAQVSPVFPAPAGVEAAIRQNEHGTTLFLLNHTNETVKIVLDQDYQNLLTEAQYKKGSSLPLKAKDVFILRRS